MPPREPKGRFFTREYMSDAAFQQNHTAEERELYIMLSLFADDAGWLEWDEDYLTFAIYRYTEDRGFIFRAGVEALQRTGRLKVLKCGHAVMPKVGKRPRGMTREYAVRDAHQEHNRAVKSSRPPYLTLPNLTSTEPLPPNDRGKRTNARAGARGAAGLDDMASVRDVVAGLDLPKKGGQE